MDDPFKISGFIMIAIVLGAALIVTVLVSKMVLNIRDTSTPNNQATVGNDTTATVATGTPTGGLMTWGGNNTAMLVSTLGVSSISTPAVYNNGSVVNQGDGLGGNWTYNAINGTVTFINASPYWNASGEVTGHQNQLVTNAINISYSYSFGSSARNITENLQQTNVQLTKTLPIAGLAIVFGTIIIVLTGLIAYNKFKE